MAAADIIRSLVKEIVLTPAEDELKIDVRGDLAGILAISLKTKTPATRAGESQVVLVAGARNHHCLRSRGSCGVEAAGLAHSILKALTVEDGSNHLKLLWQAVA